MLDLDRFVIELDNLTTAVHFYDEVYSEAETIRILSRLSDEAARIIQLSLHNDIVMSIARLLFDGDKYKTSEKVYEYLSQYNLVKKYEKYIDGELQLHRDKIAEKKKILNVKDYRDLVLAHNDKATLTGEEEHPRHNLAIEDILEMLRESRQLFFGIRLKLAQERGEKNIPVSPCNVLRNGVGEKFIRKINNITNLDKGRRKRHPC